MNLLIQIRLLVLVLYVFMCPPAPNEVVNFHVSIGTVYSRGVPTSWTVLLELPNAQSHLTTPLSIPSTLRIRAVLSGIIRTLVGL